MSNSSALNQSCLGNVDWQGGAASNTDTLADGTLKYQPWYCDYGLLGGLVGVTWWDPVCLFKIDVHLNCRCIEKQLPPWKGDCFCWYCGSEFRASLSVGCWAGSQPLIISCKVAIHMFSCWSYFHSSVWFLKKWMQRQIHKMQYKNWVTSSYVNCLLHLDTVLSELVDSNHCADILL